MHACMAAAKAHKNNYNYFHPRVCGFMVNVEGYTIYIAFEQLDQLEKQL